jgi:hypothetical protein
MNRIVGGPRLVSLLPAYYDCGEAAAISQRAANLSAPFLRNVVAARG